MSSARKGLRALPKWESDSGNTPHSLNKSLTPAVSSDYHYEADPDYVPAPKE